MKTNLLLVVFALSSVLGFSQVNNVSIHDVQFVSIADLNACTDLSAFSNSSRRSTQYGCSRSIVGSVPVC